MSDQDLWKLDPHLDGMDAKKSKLRQMKIFAALLVVALILVAAILIWAANDRQAKLKSSHQKFTNSYSTENSPADGVAQYPGVQQYSTSPTPSTRAEANANSRPYEAPDVRSFNRRDSVDEPTDGEDSNLRMQMLTMRDNYENQLALYRQQLEDQRQLIATQRLLIDQLQAQNKTNTPDAQTGYAGLYRCSNCGAGMNWARTDTVPDPTTGGTCNASANGQHFWIRM